VGRRLGQDVGHQDRGPAHRPLERHELADGRLAGRRVREAARGQRGAATPNTSDEDTLNGVAAIAPTSAFAAGTFTQTGRPIPIDRTLAARWNGATRSADPSVSVGTTDNLLQGAAAIPGTRSAWAVGFRLTASGPDQTLIERDTSG
jgi:hypothetical protein